MESKVIPAFKEIHCEGHAEKLEGCGRTVHTAICNSCSTVHFQGFDRCRSKWCVPCSAMKTKVWLHRLLPVIQKHVENGGACSLLTLTMVDQPELGTMIESMGLAWRYMTHGNRNNREIWKSEINGGVRSMEVKLGKNSGLWHAHFHILLLHDTGKRFYKWIMNEWDRACLVSGAVKSATNDKYGSIDIRGINTKNGAMGGIIECVKYPVKPEPQLWTNSSALHEAYWSLKGKKQTQTFGCLYGLAKKVEEEDKIADEKKLTEFICQHCGCTEATLEYHLYSRLDGTVLYDIDK